MRYLKAALEWCNPFHEQKGVTKRDGIIALLGYGVVHLLLLIIVTIAGGVFAGRAVYDSQFWRAHHVTIVQKAPLTSQQVHVLTSMEIQDAQAAACYVPPTRLFRLSGVYAVVESQYWYDSSALGSVACQDTDELLPYATSEPLKLPGPAWVHYHYVQGGYIAGSGYYITVQTPNGGRWTFFHVRSPHAYGFGQSIAGGTVIGDTGWPSSLTYSNGSCYDDFSCRSDAHECIATDYAGATWFYRLATNPPKKPAPPFNSRGFESWRVSHHKRPIPWKSHGKLTWPASIYRAHPKLGPIHQTSYHKGKPGYRLYVYRSGRAYAFDNGAVKLHWGK